MPSLLYIVMDNKLVTLANALYISDLNFIDPAGNIVLPKLKPNVTYHLGILNKTILIKKSVFEKNKKNHKELSTEDSRRVLFLALTETSIVINDKPNGKPYYWILVHESKENNAVVTIDVDPRKKYIEVVGWRKVRDRSVNQIKNRAIREGGQILITQGVAAGLSALTDSSVFGCKDNKTFENTSK